MQEQHLQLIIAILVSPFEKGFLPCSSRWHWV